MNGSTHSLDYKGYTIICENGLYWISVFPMRKFFSINAVKFEIDKITRDLDENIPTILKRFSRN